MKRPIKAMAVMAAATILTFASATSAMAHTGWMEKSGKWYYYNEDGTKLTNGWVASGDNWYWINSTGNMSVNRWVEFEGNLYYLQEDGVMAANRFAQYKKKIYYLGAEGYAVKNQWVQSAEGKWYYMEDTNALTIGFREIDGYMYYFDGNGVMQTNMSVGGYQLGNDGKAVQ